MSSKGIAFCTRIDEASPALDFYPFVEDETEDETQQTMKRLGSVQDALNAFLLKYQHYGEMVIRIELPSLNPASPGAARASTVVIGFSYAVWGLLTSSHRHRARLIHNATAKSQYRHRMGVAGGIQNKVDIANAISEKQNPVYARILAGFPKSQQQDVLDAVLLAYGVEA